MESTCNQTLLLCAGGGITSRGKKKKPTRSRRRGVCFSRGFIARASSSSSSSDDDDDNNKAPLSSLNSAIELRSKLQEVALAARTRCVDSVRVHARARSHRTFLFLRLLLSLSLSLSLTTLCVLCAYKQTNQQQSRKQLERYFQRPNGVRVRTKVAVDDVGIRAFPRRSRLGPVSAGVLR